MGVPLLLVRAIGGLLPSTPAAVGEPFVLAFGVPIVTLQVLGALTSGELVSVPFLSGSYLVEAFYIWAAVNGGVFSFHVQALSITLAFQPLLFLLMLPSLFWSVRVPVTYLLEQSEASAPAPDSV